MATCAAPEDAGLRVRLSGVIRRAAWLIASLGAFPFLGMVKFRCHFGNGWPCGWMSFYGGVTWHIIPAAWITLSVGLIAWSLNLDRALRPLVGAWLALAWYTLPVGIIHPPSHGGPCPEWPILCHDRPLLGFGGLFYWLAPFVTWTAVRMVRHRRATACTPR